MTREPEVTLADFGGARLLVSDTRVLLLLLLNDARDRVVGRLFGVSRERSGLVALIALAMIAQSAHEKGEQLLRGPGGP